MKRILLSLVVLSSIVLAALVVPEMTVTTLAVGGSDTGSISGGVFYPSVNGLAALRFEFKLAQHVLFNRAGSSEIRYVAPFGDQEAVLDVSDGEPYPSAPKDYLQRLDPITVRLKIPQNAKTGVYNVKLIARIFLCEGVLKVCYFEETPGSFEIRVGQTGRDTPVKLEYVRPQR